MGYRGTCLQFLGIIPDQTKPGADLIDKRSGWPASFAGLKSLDVCFRDGELFGLLLLRQSPFGTKLAHALPERCHPACRFRRSIT